MCGFQLIIIIIALSFSKTVVTSKISSNFGLTTEQIIVKYDYPFENHTVQTSDGYLLTLHRIPYGVKSRKTSKTRPSVLIMHGFLSCSADFVIIGPDKSLSFLLADAGYDVWLGNHRGTTWSRRHIKIDPDKENAKFYNFTLHELGTLDLSAKIDYILAITHQKSLTYIGHSQGTTVGFILLAERPEYNAKIRMVICLAPVVYVKYARSPIFPISSFIYDIAKPTIESLNYYELLPNTIFLRPLVIQFCSQPIFKEICAVGLFSLCGFDSSQLDRDLLPVICTNDPAGVSVQQGVHYTQMYKSDQFTRYDYGTDGNLVKYGQIQPPKYNLSKVTTLVNLHYSTNDYFSSVKDVKRLARELSNVRLKRVPLPEFNHIDFVWAIDVVELLYNELIADIKN